MSIRVHELAKELNLSNEEIMDRLDKMGSPVTSHSSNVSDIDAAAIRNIVIHSRQKSETKIVKVAPKKSDAEGQKDAKVSVKPAPRSCSNLPLSSSVKPGLRRFVFGFLRSISLWATFRSPQRITGFLPSNFSR